MPYPSSESGNRNATRAIQNSEAAPEATPTGVRDLPSTDYRPLSTLAPTSWTPVIKGGGDQWQIGASVAGYDVLGYHGYAATATWRMSSPDGAPTPAGATPDWQLSYAYTRWRPTFFASASAQTSFFAGPATAAGPPSAATLLARELQAGIVLPMRQVRVSHQALASVIHSANEYTDAVEQLSRIRRAARAAWLTSSARTYGYSISPEDGVSAGATAEFVRRSFGAFADANVLTGDVRAYIPAFAAHHVAAVRVAEGLSSVGWADGRYI